MNKYTIEAKYYGKYDVVVCGGGTAGCFAAIAAAREGAKTLLVERSFTLGGMLTVGDAGITKFTEHCKNPTVYKEEVIDRLGENSEDVQVVRGLPREYVKRMIAEGSALGSHGDAGSYVFTDKARAQLTLVEMLDEAGCEVLYDSRVCLVTKEGTRVKSCVLANKSGFVEVEAEIFIDTTGDADVAELAGAQTLLGATEEDIAEGGATYLGQKMAVGVMYRVGGVDFKRVFDFLGNERPDLYEKQPYGIMEYEDAKASYERGDMSTFRILLDVSALGQKEPDRMQVYTLPNREDAILLGFNCYIGGTNGVDARDLSAAQTRLQKSVTAVFEKCVRKVPGFEKARITYIPDVGVRETRRIVGEYTLNALDVLKGVEFEDSIAAGGHPCDVQPLPPEVENMNFDHWRFHIPYRCLLPKSLDNLIVAGRCVSVTRVALGAVRPTAQCMAMGEAAGIAAAMLAGTDTAARDIDVKALRARLTEVGAII